MRMLLVTRRLSANRDFFVVFQMYCVKGHNLSLTYIKKQDASTRTALQRKGEHPKTLSPVGTYNFLLS